MGVRSMRKFEGLEIESTRGLGTVENPVRIITQYFDAENLNQQLFEIDPYEAEVEEEAKVESPKPPEKVKVGRDWEPWVKFVETENWDDMLIDLLLSGLPTSVKDAVISAWWVAFLLSRDEGHLGKAILEALKRYNRCYYNMPERFKD